MANNYSHYLGYSALEVTHPPPPLDDSIRQRERYEIKSSVISQTVVALDKQK
jgi:hypothetical protein